MEKKKTLNAFDEDAVKQSVRYRDETQDADIITAWKRMEIVPTLK